LAKIDAIIAWDRRRYSFGVFLTVKLIEFQPGKYATQTESLGDFVMLLMAAARHGCQPTNNAPDRRSAHCSISRTTSSIDQSRDPFTRLATCTFHCRNSIRYPFGSQTLLPRPRRLVLSVIAALKKLSSPLVIGT
jgi:hypothetical protein